MTLEQAELESLIERYLDGGLDPAAKQQLDTVLQTDPAARETYWRLAETHVLVRTALQMLAGAETAPLGEDGEAVKHVEMPNEAQAPGNARPLHSAKAYLLNIITQPTPLSLGIASGFTLIVILAMAFLVLPTRESNLANQSKQAIVAHLTSDQSAGWNTGMSRLLLGEALREGDTVLLQSGVVELTYKNGVVIALAGPCRYTVTDLATGRLQQGRLVATVPKEAVGFTVHTPLANVVDLGTQFGVDVSSEKVVSISVLDGRVRAESTHAGQFESVELIAGQALKINADSRFTETNEEEIEKSQRLLQSLYSRQLTNVRVSDVSSELVSNGFDRSANHLVDQSGLDNGKHDCNPDQAAFGTNPGNMWLSEGEKDPVASGQEPPALAHVTFDLGERYALTSIQVWNYNEKLRGLFNRGAKDVEIWVSSTDDASNLKKLSPPSGRFLFPIATGQPDYRGFAIRFDDISNAELLQRVRLVRFKIISNHGPHAPNEDSSFTGLSEVKFFARNPGSE
jgi:hypothetical protein